MKVLSIVFLLALCVALACAAPSEDIGQGVLGKKRGRDAFESGDERVPSDIKRTKGNWGTALRRGMEKFELPESVVRTLKFRIGRS